MAPKYKWEFLMKLYGVGTLLISMQQESVQLSWEIVQNKVIYLVLGICWLFVTLLAPVGPCWSLLAHIAISWSLLALVTMGWYVFVPIIISSCKTVLASFGPYWLLLVTFGPCLKTSCHNVTYTAMHKFWVCFYIFISL